MAYFEEKTIKDFLSATGLIVGSVDLDYEEYIAEVLIEINATGLYTVEEIINIVNKIKELESTLVKQGFIHDIKFGDIYQGSWRILIHFLNEDEIEEWEKNAIANNL